MISVCLAYTRYGRAYKQQTIARAANAVLKYVASHASFQASTIACLFDLRLALEVVTGSTAGHAGGMLLGKDRRRASLVGLKDIGAGMVTASQQSPQLNGSRIPSQARSLRGITSAASCGRVIYEHI